MGHVYYPGMKNRENRGIPVTGSSTMSFHLAPQSLPALRAEDRGGGVIFNGKKILPDFNE